MPSSRIFSLTRYALFLWCPQGPISNYTVPDVVASVLTSSSPILSFSRSVCQSSSSLNPSMPSSQRRGWGCKWPAATHPNGTRHKLGCAYLKAAAKWHRFVLYRPTGKRLFPRFSKFWIKLAGGELVTESNVAECKQGDEQANCSQWADGFHGCKFTVSGQRYSVLVPLETENLLVRALGKFTLTVSWITVCLPCSSPSCPLCRMMNVTSNC